MASLMCIDVYIQLCSFIFVCSFESLQKNGTDEQKIDECRQKKSPRLILLVCESLRRYTGKTEFVAGRKKMAMEN